MSRKRINYSVSSPNYFFTAMYLEDVMRKLRTNLDRQCTHEQLDELESWMKTAAPGESREFGPVRAKVIEKELTN